MKHRAWIVAFVLALAVGCEMNALPPVPPPAPYLTPSSRDQFVDALGDDPRCWPSGGLDFAHRPYPTPLSVEDAELILVCTTSFELGLMPPKRQGQAFNVLWAQPDAVARFRTVATAAGPAGRLYALAALQTLTRPEADRIAAELARDTRQVFVQDSDVVRGLRAASDLIELVKRRQVGEEFLRDRVPIADHFSKVR